MAARSDADTLCPPTVADVDVIFLQNPFDFLARDSDIEGMSDGWDNGTAYGKGRLPLRRFCCMSGGGRWDYTQLVGGRCGPNRATVQPLGTYPDVLVAAPW